MGDCDTLLLVVEVVEGVEGDEEGLTISLESAVPVKTVLFLLEFFKEIVPI